MMNDKLCTKHIKDALAVSRELIILADDGERDSQDDGCVLLFGIIRDCAYKIKKEAGEEKNRHITLGKWDESE